jgi:hypothetical protein
MGFRDRPTRRREATRSSTAEAPTPSTIPMLASGCPDQCDFCIDWDNAHRQLPTDRLTADLHCLAGRLSDSVIALHDPNFAVKFDQVFDVLESMRPPYMMERSLTVLREQRQARLKETMPSLLSVLPSLHSDRGDSQPE